MLPKISCDDYSFDIVQDGNGVITTVTQKSTGKTKVYKQASGSVYGLTYHMNSLTDDQLKDMLKNAVRIIVEDNGKLTTIHGKMSLPLNTA